MIRRENRGFSKTAWGAMRVDEKMGLLLEAPEFLSVVLADPLEEKSNGLDHKRFYHFDRVMWLTPEMWKELIVNCPRLVNMLPTPQNNVGWVPCAAFFVDLAKSAPHIFNYSHLESKSGLTEKEISEVALAALGTRDAEKLRMNKKQNFFFYFSKKKCNMFSFFF